VSTRALAGGLVRSLDRPYAVATIVGVAAGVMYALSPLTTLGLIALVLIGRALGRDVPHAERRIVITVFVVAVVLRLLVVAALFLSIDHTSTPFGSLFGDEEYFKRRSMWLRSMAVGVNVSEADRIYALDEYSDTSYLYLLAFVQILVGDAPYGVHVFSTVAFMGAAVWLFRWSRRVYGPAPAGLAFVGVLFLPTLFFWSVSALRESVHFLLTLAAIIGTAEAMNARGWGRRLTHVAVALAAVLALRHFREGSMAVVLIAMVVGCTVAFAVTSWRRAVVVGVLALAVTVAAISRPAVQDRLMSTLRSTALMHQGHAFTPGVHYKVLDPRFYRDRTLNIFRDMTWGEAGRYVLRAVVAATVMPLPWQAQTMLLRAYVPEHVVWLLLVALLPFGVWAAARREPAGSFVMAAYIAVMFVGVALRSGNVGTLARHRGLVLPFVICMGAVAVCHLLWRLAERAEARGSVHGPA
jgi:hypothetical protein